ncbi:hypothetical protein BU25DRAFT_298512, partial [Macroventuria anomochaeta]
ISKYISKKLTFRRDRLNAVSSIARLISRSLDEIFRPKEYLAELWFEPDLNNCWKMKDPTETFNEMMKVLKSEETYCAPSWSWAS